MVLWYAESDGVIFVKIVWTLGGFSTYFLEFQYFLEFRLLLSRVAPFYSSLPRTVWKIQ